MNEATFKARLRTWLWGFAVITLTGGLYILPSNLGLGALALAFAVIEFFAIRSLSK
ncbi:MAG: hypothetical protein IT205_05520 [Fimbriimonadaceae bacterium]|jgi:hypothetical protein|nr:hypothetical protein [Fimbriimonadaceae bacterium]